MKSSSSLNFDSLGIDIFYADIACISSRLDRTSLEPKKHFEKAATPTITTLVLAEGRGRVGSAVA
jgi:hypothetical protein